MPRSLFGPIAAAALALALLALTGCAATPPPSPLLSEISQAAACVEEVEEQAAFQPLRVKSPPLGSMTSVHLGDTAKPTPEELDIVKNYLAAVTACRPKTDAILNPREQAAGRAVLSTWNEQEQLYIALSTGRLNWGQFNRMTEALERRMDRQLRGAIAAAM